VVNVKITKREMIDAKSFWNRISFCKSSSTLFVICICGLVGLGLDADHAKKLIGEDKPLTLHNLNTQANRFLHIPALFIVWSLFVGYIAYYNRLLKRSIDG
tara:strand:- start:4453 stop:4755 length:303 start_codon:yes stop_codon:yes gene_type:complete